MCGLTGLWNINKYNSTKELIDSVEQMANSLFHRGPDDSGTWCDDSSGIAFGHRRLAIVDLSSAGHQPMHSKSNRYVIAYNGEIYNHNLLRKEIIKSGFNINWFGHSDTETLLAAIEIWGLEKTLNKCVGMFAIALWDKKTKTLELARDRIGEKPLYYGWIDGVFVFGSELKSLRANSNFNASVYRESLVQYLRFLYVPAPLSIYKKIYKLEPGTILTIVGNPPEKKCLKPIEIGEKFGTLSIRSWWTLSEAIGVDNDNGKNKLINEKETITELESVLITAVKQQSLADVPLGAFLSGGIDSSTIVALMQKESMSSIKSFTIGYEEDDFDEAPYARAVANHLGTEHHELQVSARIAQNVIPLIPCIYDEPFADSSQIPTYLVSKLAKKNVTVALSGDGGDELFAGYNRYIWGPRIWNKIEPLPAAIRKLVILGLKTIPVSGLNTLFNPFIANFNNIKNLENKIDKLIDCLKDANNLNDIYRNLVSVWEDPNCILIEEKYNKNIEISIIKIDESNLLKKLESPLNMMYWDTLTYLPDDILCKIDRASMANSLETRVPFLDQRVIEQAWRLPKSMKLKNNEGKWALKQILYKYVPMELIERPKSGFAIPIGMWLKGPLKEWAESLISEKRLLNEGFFKSDIVRKYWNEHLKGNKDHSAKLWSILMFQAWLEQNP